MSLELAVEKLTARFDILIAILAAEDPPAITAPAAEDLPKAKCTKKEAAPATVGEPVEELSVPSPAPGAIDASETGAAAAPAVDAPTYEDVKKAVNALTAKKGVKVSRDLLSSFGGTKTFQEVHSTRWGEVIASAQAILSEEIPF